MEIDLRSFKIVGGAMSWISDARLVSAISNAGALGVLATGAMVPGELDATLMKIKGLTSQIYGVNLIGMSPYFDELLAVCADHRVSIIIVAATVPRQVTIAAIKSMGARVIAFASSLSIAQHLIKNGVDALILEGNEAGGHVGSIATSVLVQEILFYIKDFPIFVAGGIGTGKMIKHYMQMGAVGCQLGTRFVCADESPMHERVKEFYVRKQAKDTVVVGAIDPVFSVIPVRVIKNAAVENFYAKQREAINLLHRKEIDNYEAQLSIENFWSGSLKRGVIEGDVESGSLMAGQSLSFVSGKESVQEIIDSLYEDISNGQGVV